MSEVQQRIRTLATEAFSDTTGVPRTLLLPCKTHAGCTKKRTKTKNKKTPQKTGSPNVLFGVFACMHAFLVFPRQVILAVCHCEGVKT